MAGRTDGGESPAAWEPILDRETWEAVCAVLTDKELTFTPTHTRTHLLSNLAVCGPCGEELVIRHNARGR